MISLGIGPVRLVLSLKEMVCTQQMGQIRRVYEKNKKNQFTGIVHGSVTGKYNFPACLAEE